jgi:hypothetical protein
MIHRRLLLASSLAAALTGCASPSPSRRLAPPTTPIIAVRIYASSGDDAALKGAAAERFSETLQANGLAVAGFTPLERPLSDLAALERRWFAAAPTTGVTHALVLTRQTAHTFTTNHVAEHYLRYEVALWEAQSRRLVWTGLLAANQRPTPQRRAEAMAGNTLRSLARDGLMSLAGQVPRDKAGLEIPMDHFPDALR